MATLTRPSLSLKRPKPLATQLAQDLTDRITRGDLQPGDKLPSEHEMVAFYGVSRTVVREAVSSLKSAGLVTARQGVGVFVQAVSASEPFRIDAQELDTVKEVISLLELRISLEAEAAALAALRRTDTHIANLQAALEAMVRGVDAHDDVVDIDFRFHQEIALATDNRYFLELFSYLGRMAIPRARIAMYQADTDARTAYLQNVNREHHMILQAIINQDPDGARAAMRLHLGNSRERLRAATQAAL